MNDQSEHNALNGNAEQSLRRRAEALFQAGATPLTGAADRPLSSATQQLLHDLQVHQIELELQNDELRQAQVQLDSERARYFDLYDLAPVGYCTLSEPGLLLEANLTAAAVLGVARSELVNRPLSRFIFNDDQDIYYLLRKQLFETGQAQSCELRLVKADGSAFWARLMATVALDANGVAQQRVMLSDISDRKLLDQALQERNLELDSARQMADKASRAKSDFLSNMSHELRSPLNAILGFAQLLGSSSPPPTPIQKVRVDHILQAGWYLLELISEILDLALIESGKLSLSLQHLSLGEVLIECEALSEPQAQQHGIGISFPQFDKPCLVNADRTRLKQIIFNLMSNAIKYNRPGGMVEVTCVASPDNRVRINVRDTGEGLSEQKLAQLFQPFNRLGQEATAVQGTGIGLVVCKRLIELMGGSIGVQSSVGGGSMFWIELNLAPTLSDVPNTGQDCG
ncbi:MAG: HAMP domain-containing sensor histidine kinase [Comamonadaceae bacterium]